MNLSLRAYPSCQIVPIPFEVLDAALEASVRELNLLELACKRSEHTRGSVVYAVEGRFQWEYWGEVGSINLRMLGKDDQGRDETELLIAPSHYPQPDMSSPTWAAEMQETRRQIDEAYEAFLKATIVALFRNLTRGERIRAAAQVVNAPPTPSGAARDLMPQQEQETTRGGAFLPAREKVSTLFDGDFTKYPEELFRIAFKVAEDLNEESERSGLYFSSGIAGIEVPPDMLRGRRQMTRIRIVEAPNCRQSEDGAITTDDTRLIGYVSIQPKIDEGGRVTIEHCGKPKPIRSEMDLNVDKEPQDSPAFIRIISAEGFDRAQWFEEYVSRFLEQADSKESAEARITGVRQASRRSRPDAIERRYRTNKVALDQLVRDFTRKYFGLEGNGKDPFRGVEVDWALGQLAVRGNVPGYTDTLGLGKLSLVVLTPTVVNDEWLKMEAWPMDWKDHPDCMKAVDEFFGALMEDLDRWLRTESQIHQMRTLSGVANEQNAILRRIDKMHLDLGEKLDDIKRSQMVIYERIGSEAEITVNSILTEVREQSVSRAEMQQTLDAIRRVLTHIQRSGLPVKFPELEQSLPEINRVVNGNMSLAQKLELAIPIVPLLLTYKVELDTEVDLRAVWKDLLEWVQRNRGRPTSDSTAE